MAFFTTVSLAKKRVDPNGSIIAIPFILKTLLSKNLLLSINIAKNNKVARSAT